MSRRDDQATAAERAEEARLGADLTALAREASEAEALLGQLAGALFPAGPPDIGRLTWPDAGPARPSGARDTLRRGEERIHAAELRYRSLVEQIPAVTFLAVLGEGRNEIYVSPHIQTLLGFTQKEWLENPFLWYSQLHPDDRALWNEEFARGCRTGGPFRAECRFIARDGRVVWVRGEARVVRDDVGRPAFLQGVAFDITESKVAEALLLRQAVQTTEERYRDLVHGLGAVVWEAEPVPFQFTLVSRYAGQMLGFDPQRWVREPGFWPSRIHPEDREAVSAGWDAAIRERTDHVLEYRVAAASGRMVWIQDSLRVIRDPDGRAQHLLGVMIDTTARKRTEEERAILLRREQTARDESETLNRVGRLLAAELDFKKLVQTVTDAGTEISGAKFGAFFYHDEGASEESHVLDTRSGASGEALGKLARMLEAMFRGGGLRRVADVTRDPRYDQMAREHRLPPGHPPARSYLIAPVVSRSGEELGGLCFGHPVPAHFTERHERMVGGLADQAAVAMDRSRLYETMERARAAAEAANRAKDEFLATMSHELRTPLHAVLGWARILRGAQVDAATTARALETIERNALAQVQLVDDILDVSRIVTGKLHLDVQPVDLSGVVQAAHDVVRLAAQAKDITLETAFDLAAPIVMGDAQRLQQVVWNLLSNAIKFTGRGGRILVRLEHAGAAARIVVRDTGAGIAPAFLPHVFDRFRQADSSSTRAHGGLGLGLAIVRHIIEQHGGEVRAESAGLGEGSAFTVEIPVTTSPSTASRRADADELEPRLPAGGMRVLVVDDQYDARELLKTILEKVGAEVVTAASTAEALACIDDVRPTMLISDIGMPDQDGYMLVRELRRRGSRVPAIAVSAYGRGGDRQIALQAGYQAYVTKPVDMRRLVEVIDRVRNGS
ncbi:MAG: PAS domain-containing protein [Candidatus Rokuibacteriota bacterium]